MSVKIDSGNRNQSKKFSGSRDAYGGDCGGVARVIICVVVLSFAAAGAGTVPAPAALFLRFVGIWRILRAYRLASPVVAGNAKGMETTHFLIRGGRPLSGRVRVQGAKNAALKIIAACLLTEERCELENVPQITDVGRMLRILQALGAEIEEDSAGHRVAITARAIDPVRLPEDDIRAMRASIVLLGPLLIRCGRVTMPYPGGDVIGARSIAAHLRVLEQFGARVAADGSHISAWLPRGHFSGGNITLPEFSVTATENALLAAAGMPVTTRIEIAALEPHVQDLGAFLNAMGADVAVVGAHVYAVRGAERLAGARHRILPDVLDAFTFLVAGIVTHGRVEVEGVDPALLTLPLMKLQDMGIRLEVRDEGIATPNEIMPFRAMTVQTLPYPGVPTDLQPLFALLATQAEGTTLLHDPLYENRFRHLAELVRMGANASLIDPHRAVIHGPTPLTGAPISSFDIRAGAVLVVAGMLANGVTKVDGIAHIERGYENLDGRLRALGADITRVTE